MAQRYDHGPIDTYEKGVWRISTTRVPKQLFFRLAINDKQLVC